MLLDEVGDLQQKRLALIGFEFAPRSLECRPRCGDRAVDILLVALRDGGEQIAGRRVAALEGLAGRGAHPFAVDQHALDFAIGIRIPDGFDRLWHCHGSLPGHYIPQNIAMTIERVQSEQLLHS